MANGRLKNENRPHKLTAEEARKGGKKSAESRRNKKTIQNILNELLNAKCSDSTQFKRIAQKLGLESEKSIKELLTYLAIINTAKNANLDELSKLTKLIGEMPEMNDNNEDVRETLIKIKECAHEQRNIDKQ